MPATAWIVHQRERFADLETPVSAFLKLRPVGARYLLETVERGAVLGRFSFIGLHPLLEVECDAEVVRFLVPGQRPIEVPSEGDPLVAVEAVLELLRPLASEEPGNLLGGAVGFLSFEYVSCLERVATHARLPQQPPLGRFLFPRSLVTFDHLKRRMHVRTMRPTAPDRAPLGGGPPIAQAAMRALALAAEAAAALPETELTEILAALHGPLPEARYSAAPATPFAPVAEPSGDEFERRARRAKEYITAGDIFQVVLSERQRGTLGIDPFQVYRALRMLNPSPYLFFLDFAPTQLVGSSPEVLVKLEGSTATVRPIAGTRARGHDVPGDRVLEEELLADEKERAEHVMLVDLGRNDLGRVCDYGSVQVTDFMTVERYSHVMHLVSYVRGTLRGNLDCFDLLRATFPAGTVSGAPKVRALEIIHELEGFRRGPYAGAVGYFGPGGDMDLCITIRTIVCHEGEAILQAGAGIVHDSEPAREHRECLGKMQVLLDAIRLAESGLS